MAKAFDMMGELPLVGTGVKLSDPLGVSSSCPAGLDA
jgi:hypothetical protein